jgi:uncharacterized protein YjbI with pentapeptide repeats
MSDNLTKRFPFLSIGLAIIVWCFCSITTVNSQVPDTVDYGGARWKASLLKDQRKVRLDRIREKQLHTIYLHYYAENDPELYKKLKNNQLVDSAYLALLDARKLLRKGSNHVNVDLAMRDCIVDSLFPCQGLQFEGVVTIRQSTFLRPADFLGAKFLQGALFSRVDFSQTADFYGATFLQEAVFDVVTFSGAVDFNDATFSQKTWFGFTTFSRGGFFTDAVFSQEASFRSAIFSHEAYFAGAKFSQRAYFFYVIFSQEADFLSAKFSHEVDFSSATFSQWVSFQSSGIGDTMLFDNTSFNGYANFSNLHFLPDTSKRGLQPQRRSLLSRSYLAEGLNLQIDQNIDSLAIRLEDLNRTWLVFDDSTKDFLSDTTRDSSNAFAAAARFITSFYSRLWTIAEHSLACILHGSYIERRSVIPENKYIDRQRILNDVIKYVNNQEKAPKDLKDDVTERLNYQLTRLEMHHAIGWRLIWLEFLELVVRNGYNGGMQFFSFLLSLVFLFAVLFFFLFRSELKLYIVEDKFIEDTRTVQKPLSERLGSLKDIVRPSRYATKEFWLQCREDLSRSLKWLLQPMRFAEAMWFSAFVFLSFKFNRDYFKFSRGLRIVVIIEWSAGLGLIAIYLIYSASRYAFVKALLGM